MLFSCSQPHRMSYLGFNSHNTSEEKCVHFFTLGCREPLLIVTVKNSKCHMRPYHLTIELATSCLNPILVSIELIIARFLFLLTDFCRFSNSLIGRNFIGVTAIMLFRPLDPTG